MLRCDGSISNGGKKSQILRRLVKEVALLPTNESVTLLDISIQNVTKLPGKLFQSLNLELSGLVVSTGALSNIDKKVGSQKLVFSRGHFARWMIESIFHIQFQNNFVMLKDSCVSSNTFEWL